MVPVIEQAHVSRKFVVHPWGRCRQSPTSQGTIQAPNAANSSTGTAPDHPVSILMNELRSTYSDGGEKTPSLAVVAALPNLSSVRTKSRPPRPPPTSKATTTTNPPPPETPRPILPPP